MKYTSTSIGLLGKTVRHHAEGVRRADVYIKLLVRVRLTKITW